MIILALIGQGFDINWAGFALLAIGVGLLAYELYSPGFGAAGIAGIIALSIGTTLLFTADTFDILFWLWLWHLQSSMEEMAAETLIFRIKIAISFFLLFERRYLVHLVKPLLALEGSLPKSEEGLSVSFPSSLKLSVKFVFHR